MTTPQGMKITILEFKTTLFQLYKNIIKCLHKHIFGHLWIQPLLPPTWHYLSKCSLLDFPSIPLGLTCLLHLPTGGSLAIPSFMTLNITKTSIP